MISIIAVVLFSILTVINVLIVCGLPLGELTMGGQHKVLPKKLRIIAAFSLIPQVFAIIVALQAGGYMTLWLTAAATRVICFVYAGYLVLNACMDAFSKSKKERYIMTPIALAAAACFLVIAIQMQA